MKKVYLIILASLFIFSAQANANDFSFYTGGGFGFTKMNIDEGGIDGIEEIESFNADDSDKGFKIFGGYRISNSFAVEVFYADLGKYSETNNELALEGGKGEPIELKIDTDAKSFGLAGVYSYAVSDIFDIFGKIGLQRWKEKGGLTISAGGKGLDSLKFSDGAILEADSDSDDGISFMTGAGVRANLLSSRLFLGGEFEWYDVDARLILLSAHAGVRF